MAAHPLAQLIEARRRDAGESYGEIAERGGERLSKSYVHKLATTDQPTMPRPEQITALATALRVPEEVVMRAAQQSAGYHVYEERLPGTDTQVLVANIEALTPEQRASVAALVHHMLGDV